MARLAERRVKLHHPRHFGIRVPSARRPVSLVPFGVIMQRIALSCLLALGLASVQPALAEEAPIPAAATTDDPVVAHVGEAVIYRSEVVEAYRGLPEQFAQIPMDAIFTELVQQLVDRKVMAIAAAAAGLENDPDYARRMAQVKDQVLEQVYVDKVIEAQVTDAVMKAKYDKILAENPP